jgi:hypothetical protein
MGCAVFTILGVIAELANRTPRWVTIVTFALAIIFFVPASYLAWKDEHEARIATENKLNSLTKPDFELEPASWAIGGGMDGDSIATAFITLSILNHGAPSAVTKWRMKIKPSNGREVYGEPWLTPGEITLPVNNRNVPFTANQSLFVSASRLPIPTGGLVGGFVVFRFPDISKAELDDSKGVGVVIVEDSLHHPYEVSVPLTVGGRTDLKVPPGMPLK